MSDQHKVEIADEDDETHNHSHTTEAIAYTTTTTVEQQHQYEKKKSPHKSEVEEQHGQEQHHQEYIKQHHQEVDSQPRARQISQPLSEQQHNKPHTLHSPSATIDHASISKYANFTLDVEDDQKNQTYLRIVGIESKGSTFTKYTAYNVKGHDKNGEIYVQRRFSEFYALRAAMVQRWPGCFIPSIPPKIFTHKNDKDQTIKRERYLNDFLIKITKLPYLYNSQQFQTFLRSKQIDTSGIYSSWSTPTYEAIINKYKDCFSDLAGKQIDSNTINTIGQFYARVKKNASLLDKYRLMAKNLALSRDRFNSCYPKIFRILPTYQKTVLTQLTQNESDLIYQNPNQAKMSEHSQIVVSSCNKNPYWALYDMIKHQERDGRAFLEAIEARESLENKRTGVENRIRDNQLAIIQLNEGKSNMKSFTTKGTKQQIKYKLQVQNEQLKKQKNLLLVLSDIISALIVYIEIPAYQFAKINFYNKTLKKIGGYELNSVQIQADIWGDIATAANGLSKKQSFGL